MADDRKNFFGKLRNITDSAISHALRKDVAGVAGCLSRRRKMLDHKDILHAGGSEAAGSVKSHMMGLLDKDRELALLLDRLAVDLKEQRDRCRKSKELKKRFAGRCAAVPKFIDKKA